MEQGAKRRPLAVAIGHAFALGAAVPLWALATTGGVPSRGGAQIGPTFFVNTVEGTANGFCGVNAGECSLPDAITAANGPGSPAAIRFTPEVQGKVIVLGDELDAGPEGFAALPAPQVDLDIDGESGVEVRRGPKAPCMRFMTVHGVNLRLANLTFQGGCAEGSAPSGDGGALWLGSGSLEADQVTFSGNTANLAGGAVFAADSEVTISEGTFVGNTAQLGGGLASFAGATVTLVGTSIQANTASLGGGIHATGRTFDLANSTLVGNTADQAGGVYLGAQIEGASLKDATLIGNTADAGASQLVAEGIGADALSLERNVFVLGSSARGLVLGSSCDLGAATAGPDNFATDPSCGNATVATVDEIGLPDSGNPAAVPGPGSVLVDAAGGCDGLDQRGLPRGVDADGLSGPDCDVGAFEVQNVPVVAVDDTPITDQDAPSGGNVTANDIDPEDEDPGTLTVTRVDGAVDAVGEPIELEDGGRLTVEASGAFLFEPDGDFDGLDSGEFALLETSYEVTDGYATDTAAISIRVNGVNDPPTARPDRYFVEPGEVLTVNAAAGVLANDEDIDGDPLEVVVPAGGAPNGQDGTLLLFPDGSFEYTAPSAPGKAVFMYTITDGEATDSAEITFFPPRIFFDRFEHDPLDDHE